MAAPVNITPGMSMRERMAALDGDDEVAQAQKEGSLPGTESLFPDSSESFEEMIPHLRASFAGNPEAEAAIDYIEFKLETGPFAPEYRGDQAIRNPEAIAYGEALGKWLEESPEAQEAPQGDGTAAPLLAAGIGATGAGDPPRPEGWGPEQRNAERVLRGIGQDKPFSATAGTDAESPLGPPEPLEGKDAVRKFQAGAPSKPPPPRPEWMPPSPAPLENTATTRRIVSEQGISGQDTVISPDKVGDPVMTPAKKPGPPMTLKEALADYATDRFSDPSQRPGAGAIGTTDPFGDPGARPGAMPEQPSPTPSPEDWQTTGKLSDQGRSMSTGEADMPSGQSKDATPAPTPDAPKTPPPAPDVVPDAPKTPPPGAFGTPEEREAFWKMALEKANDPRAQGPIPKLPGAPGGGFDLPISEGDGLPRTLGPAPGDPPKMPPVEAPAARSATTGKVKSFGLGVGAAVAGLIVPATMYAIMTKLYRTAPNQEVKDIVMKLVGGGFDKPNMDPLSDPEIPEGYGSLADQTESIVKKHLKPGVEVSPDASSDKLIADTSGVFAGGAEADQDKLDLRGSLQDVGMRAFERSKKKLDDRDVASKAGIFGANK